MQNQLKALSLSYKNAPIAIREMVSLNETACKHLLDKIKTYTNVLEALVLSTCNRTEVYYTSDKDLSLEIIKLIAIEKGFLAIKKVEPYFQRILEPEQAVQHLFRVALGLESQVVGDFQILNQVKNAYQWSADAGMAGPFLHRLLHTVFFTNKRVTNETAFRDGAASVSYATVELVEEITQFIKSPRVLMIGVGEMGTNVCLNFQKSKIKDVVVANRTYHKAAELAQKANARVVSWENITAEMQAADVIISSVPGDCFFISKQQVAELPASPHKYFIDLSMPRSVDDKLATLPGVEVYNIDTIKNRATEALEQRLAAIPQVNAIIAEAILEFDNWAREMVISPAIQQFKSLLEQIRQQEVNRALKSIDPANHQVIEAITKNILNKIVKLPVLELKAACQRGESENLLAGLTALFNLEKQEV
ncbi:glutamyl-tRNA reductase [Adhaeribacter radiodurans]|uniref:Glutamyl-tRNA reductase n=1 Tax=Adhaeribacter radiodurans TaxID=2745197 RepID=A0A7L7L1H5_9BACT|nr:glutamyl-tRNA reductase [Adhaeribacter radiodurans]QMU26643.1 glutamyl-tRNA reductase [Adhaeribacter radiodurans]